MSPSRTVVLTGAAHGEAPAIHLKSYRGNGGTVEDITYSDIRINNAKIAMGFDMYFHGEAIWYSTEKQRCSRARPGWHVIRLFHN